MRLALIGATGRVGQRILNEALARGHLVTAVARNPRTLAPRDGLRCAVADATDPIALASALSGHDAVVSSIGFGDVEPKSLIDAVRRSGVVRYLAVGGAGTLEVAPGVQLLDTPQFPAAFRDRALLAARFLDAMRSATDLDWTVLSPPDNFAPGLRTGVFRLGEDNPVYGADGAARISYEDFAVALIDEIETPARVRQRFTVGY